MHLLLSSRALINTEMTTLFLSFAEGCKHISIITTAAMAYKEKNRNTVSLSNKLLDLSFKVQFIDVEFDRPEKLLESELIIIGGGNPYYHLHHLKKSGADHILKNRVVQQYPLMGISAGILVCLQDLAIVDLLTPEMNTIQLSDKSGLGFVDEVVVPHYDRFVAERKVNPKLIDEFERNTQKPIVRLGEYQTIHLKSGKKRIIGKANSYPH